MIVKNFKLIIFFTLFSLLISSCADGQINKSSNAQETNSSILKSNIDEILKKQILLTNFAKFTNNRLLEGASGFLINYKNSVFAVTARHLLGEAGGITPEIGINDLDKSLLKWEMMPRVVNNTSKETIKLESKGLDYSQSTSDILFLKVKTKDYEIQELTPNFDLPKIGETIFLIGCPYNETKCKQNSYPAKYVQFFESKNSLVFELNTTVDLRGFSGAPVVNNKGEVLGILTSSFTNQGKEYSMATHIKEIEKIKY